MSLLEIVWEFSWWSVVATVFLFALAGYYHFKYRELNPITFYSAFFGVFLIAVPFVIYGLRVDYALHRIYGYHKAMSLPETACPSFVDDALSPSCYENGNIVFAFARKCPECVDVYISDGKTGLKVAEKLTCRRFRSSTTWLIYPEPKDIVSDRIFEILGELLSKDLPTVGDADCPAEINRKKELELRTEEAARLLKTKD